MLELRLFPQSPVDVSTTKIINVKTPNFLPYVMQVITKETLLTSNTINLVLIRHKPKQRHTIRKTNIFAGNFLQVNSHHNVFELASNEPIHASCFSNTATHTPVQLKIWQVNK